jgi:hypothetical protein
MGDASYGWHLGWGWTLGALVAGGAFLMYIISRTLGLPSLTEAEFFEPMGGHPSWSRVFL